jgi:hypothetical protein
MDDSVPDDLWAEYASLQERAKRATKLTHSACAIEDQMNEFLDALDNSSLPVDEEARAKQQKNLLINRQNKHRHRLALLQAQAATTPTSSPPEQVTDPLIVAELIVLVRTLTTTWEWRILVLLACDHDYASIAQREALSVAALKTRVTRCRQRLRLRLAA